MAANPFAPPLEILATNDARVCLTKTGRTRWRFRESHIFHCSYVNAFVRFWGQRYFESHIRRFPSLRQALPAFRLKDHGFLYDKAGLSFYAPSKADALYALGLCNSSFSVQISRCFAPTMNFQLGDIWRIPHFTDRPRFNAVKSLVEDNLTESRNDWDAFETSWDFERHPLVQSGAVPEGENPLGTAKHCSI